MNPQPCDDGWEPLNTASSLHNRAQALWQEVQAADRVGRGRKTLRAIAEKELQRDVGAGLVVVEELLERVDQTHRLDMWEELLQVLGATPFRVLGESVRAYWAGRKAHRTGNYRTAEQNYKMALTTSAKDLRRKALTLEGLGRLYFEMGRFGLAERLYQQAVRTFRQADDVPGLAQVSRHLSELYRRQRRWTRSLYYSRKALVLLRPQGASHTVGRLLLNTGIIYRIKGQWGLALSYCQQAHQTFKAISDDLGMALALQQLGRTYYFQGDWDRARDLTEEALQKLRSLHADGEVRIALRNLGEIYLAMGDLKRAEHHLRDGLALCQQRDDQYMGAQIRSCLGNVCRARRNLPQALEHFDTCLKTMENIGDEHGMGWVLCDVARLHQERGQFREGLRCAERSLAVMRFYRNRYRQVEALLVICSLLESTKAWDRIGNYLQEAKRWARRFGYVNHQAWLSVLEGHLQLHQEQFDQAWVAYEHALRFASRFNCSLLRTAQEEITARLRKYDRERRNASLPLLPKWKDRIARLSIREEHLRCHGCRNRTSEISVHRTAGQKSP